MRASRPVHWFGRSQRIDLAVVPTKRPPRTTSAERSRKMKQRRLIAGRCQDCGKKRTRYRHRCDTCQANERERWNRAYGHNFKTLTKRPARPRRRNPADFAKKIAGWARVGWDPIERLRKERRKR